MANQVQVNNSTALAVIKNSNGLNLVNPLRVNNTSVTSVIRNASAANSLLNPARVNNSYVIAVIRKQPQFSINADGTTLNVAMALPGIYPVKIRVTDSNSDTHEKTFNISITD